MPGSSISTRPRPTGLTEPEPEQDQAIERLVTSNSFAETHGAIRRLLPFAEFTPEQVATLVAAANDNSQVRGIMEDDDVFEFYDALARQYGSSMASDQWDKLNDRLRDGEAFRSSRTQHWRSQPSVRSVGT
jgi:hypothetical protein